MLNFILCLLFIVFYLITIIFCSDYISFLLDLNDVMLRTIIHDELKKIKNEIMSSVKKNVRQEMAAFTATFKLSMDNVLETIRICNTLPTYSEQDLEIEFPIREKSILLDFDEKLKDKTYRDMAVSFTNLDIFYFNLLK